MTSKKPSKVIKVGARAPLREPRDADALVSEALRSGQAGATIQTPRGDMFIVRLHAPKALRQAPEDQRASTLLPKVGRALGKPGINRDVVFSAGASTRVYAYSVDPHDPSRMIREDANGTHTVGRVVNGVFKPLQVPA